MQTPMKSANMISATGRKPASAAPAAAPTMADSLIGVSMTRSAPNFGSRPLVTPKMPPDASRSPDVPPAPPETSSPSTMTRGSRAISWCRAWLTDSRMESCGIVGLRAGSRRRHRSERLAARLRPLIAYVDVSCQIAFARQHCGFRRADSLVNEREHIAGYGIELTDTQRSVHLHARTEALQTIHRLALPSDFILGTIFLGVAFEVPIKPRGSRLYGARSTAAACPPHRAQHCLVDRKEIRPVHLFRGHAETPRAAGDVFRADRVRDAGVLAIAVVFEHENCRRLQHDSQVHRLEHRSLVTAAVAAESDADVPLPP